MSASSELVALCRSQVSLLTQSLGASLSAVYLAEELFEQGEAHTKFIPIVVYPEAAVWTANITLVPDETTKDEDLLLLADAGSLLTPSLIDFEPTEVNDTSTNSSSRSLQPSRQIVLPLMHEDVLMGLLVTSREDRPWSVQERGEIERIAQTLALASVLDQRREWYDRQLTQQQHLMATQRDLLDTLLHQLRNPLTALRTFGKLLMKRFALGDANRSVAENIVRESDRIQDLLKQFEQVIDLTPEVNNSPKSLPAATLHSDRSISPAPPVLMPNIGNNLELCSVADILQPLLVSAGAIAQERNITLNFDIPAQLPPVKAHPLALREVLSNLLDNALKYTLSGGQVYVQVSQEELQQIAVSDTGAGIPPQDLAHMFERHYRGVQAHSSIPGTGLGLAIAKDLVEQMQGKIEIYSPAKAGLNVSAKASGTTVIVWLQAENES